jgi:hypothetical protein
MFAASAAFEIGRRCERSLVSGARRMNIEIVIEYKGYRIEVSPRREGLESGYLCARIDPRVS